jgi:hypothetical protein
MGVPFYRLWPRRPRDGLLSLGLSCDEEGLCFASHYRLVTAALDRLGRRFYRPQPLGEINAALTAGYAVAVNAAPLYPAITRIAEYMTRGEWTLATLAAVHLGLPELPDQAAAHRLLKTTATVWDSAKHPRWAAQSTEGHGGQFRPADGSDGDQLSLISDTNKEPSAAEERAKKLEVVRRDRSIFRVLRVLKRAVGIVDTVEDAKKLSDMIDDINDLIKLSNEKSPRLQRSLDPPKDLEELRADTEFRSFSSFEAFKEYYGSPGEGYEWHHIVE